MSHSIVYVEDFVSNKRRVPFDLGNHRKVGNVSVYVSVYVFVCVCASVCFPSVSPPTSQPVSRANLCPGKENAYAFWRVMLNGIGTHGIDLTILQKTDL